MGKGGCEPPTTSFGVNDDKNDSSRCSSSVSSVTVLKKECEEKKLAEPKFYWADDEEPHRRR